MAGVSSGGPGDWREVNNVLGKSIYMNGCSLDENGSEIAWGRFPATSIAWLRVTHVHMIESGSTSKLQSAERVVLRL
jgi:hypothetical protein